MRIESVRIKIRTIVKRWNKQYSLNPDPKHNVTGERLASLDLETATSEDISHIVGNNSWTSLPECDECGGKIRVVVRLGFQDDDTHFDICESCLGEALSLAARERCE